MIDDTIDESDVLKVRLAAIEDVDVVLAREADASVLEGDVNWAELD